MGWKIVEINVSANVCKHFVCAWKVHERKKWAKKKKDFRCGLESMSIKKNWKEVFYPVKEIPRELKSQQLHKNAIA